MKQGHTFRLLIHIDSIEDLSFYHRPADQLNAEGRVQLREFCWALGHLDGDMDDDDVRMALRFYRSSDGPIRRHRDEDDADRDCGCPRHRELLGSISRCLGQRRSRVPPADRDRHGGWFRGESSRRCGVPARDASSPPSRGDFNSEEKRALRGMWVDVDAWHSVKDVRDEGHQMVGVNGSASHAIIIEPSVEFDVAISQQGFSPPLTLHKETDTVELAHHQQITESDAIVIQPQDNMPLGNKPGPAGVTLFSSCHDVIPPIQESTAHVQTEVVTLATHEAHPKDTYQT
jgi:hypothetical protein